MIIPLNPCYGITSERIVDRMKDTTRKHIKSISRKNEFLEELNALESKFLNDLIKLADKYGKDRDETVFIMSMVFTDIAMETTFKEYEVK